MKFFNWMHKKFNHNAFKEGFTIHVKKTESIEIDTNTKALLEQVALVDVLDGWKNGLLTIGTFGFDPIAHFDEHMECVDVFSATDDYDDDQVEDDQSSGNGADGHNDEAENDNDADADQVDHELNPLMSGAFGSDYGDEGNFGAPDEILIVTSGPCMGPTGETSLDGAGQEIRRRKTLRDLFYEDSDAISDTKKEAGAANSGRKKAEVPPKKGSFFAKKVIPAPENRPIKKLNQMIRRMLKRKIHPELQGKPCKLEKENKISVREAYAGEKLGAAESISLLQISGNRI